MRILTPLCRSQARALALHSRAIMCIQGVLANNVQVCAREGVVQPPRQLCVREGLGSAHLVYDDKVLIQELKGGGKLLGNGKER